MAISRANIVDQNFIDQVASAPVATPQADLNQPLRSGFRLTGRQAIGLFESMVGSRHLDLVSRELKTQGQSFYTIGSSGHDANAGVAAVQRVGGCGGWGPPQ